MKIACSSNERYLPRIRPYLESLNANSQCGGVLVTVDCDAPAEYRVGLDRIEFVRFDRELMSIPAPLDHLQNGDFLKVVSGDDNEVIIFTDGDVIIQRPFTPNELSLLHGWPAGKVGLVWNAGQYDTLFTEAPRLGPRRYIQPEEADQWEKITCYNFGVIVARRLTWRTLNAQYIKVWPWVDELFSHYAKQQWGLCYALTTDGIGPRLLPHTFHMHGCYPLPAGGELRPDGAYYTGQKVLFRHHL